jgi:hypothetical protein
MKYGANTPMSDFNSDSSSESDLNSERQFGHTYDHATTLSFRQKLIPSSS